jgi:hypothetical protein
MALRHGRPIVGIAVLLLATCGGGAGVSSGGTTTGPTASTSDPGASTSAPATTESSDTPSTDVPATEPVTEPATEPATEAPAPPDDDGFDYMPWGANDPLIPGQYGALTASSAAFMDCEQLRDQAPGDGFWSTAVAVCDALRGAGSWPTKATTTPPPGDNAYQACLNGELAAMLQSALGWHKAHPGAAPNLRFPGASTVSPCRTHLYGKPEATAADQDEYPDGGVVVTLSAPGLGDVSDDDVSVDGVRGVQSRFDDDENDGLYTGQLFLPAPVAAHTAKVEIQGDVSLLRFTVKVPAVEATSTTEATDATTDDDTTTTATGTSTTTTT